MSLSQQPDGFARALIKFKKGLDPSLAQQFSICTLEDVRILADKIQLEQGPQGKLRHLQRLEPFIEAMTQLGTVIEVFTNASKFVCFIWGPIKFLLALAKTHLDSLNKLLEAYGKIASSISGLERYKEAFQSHPPLAKVLEDYYSDILNFHERAFEVFRRPNWKMLFDAAWKRFNSKFGPILQSLDSRRALLDSEKASATLFEIHHVLDEIKENGKEQAEMKKLLEDMKHEQQKELIKKRLSPPNYLRDHEQISRKRADHSGKWIFTDPRYQAWHNSTISGSKLLYVHGKPGGGKSTLMSTVIEQLLASKTAGAVVAFFYFRQSHEDKNTSRGSFDNLLRALLYQLIDQDPDLTDSITNMSGNDRLRLDSTSVLQDLVSKAAGTHTTLYLVLDGLDECQSDEETHIIEWLLGLGQSVFGLRVMLAGQRDNVTDKLLSSQPSISLDTSSKHHHDIETYCQNFVEKIRRLFDTKPLLERTIVELVSNGAKDRSRKYACPKFDYDLEEQLKPVVFPDSLEEAYKKVDERVFENSARPRSVAASEILSYVIGCKRTLFWREIQAFFCIDASEGEVVHKKRIIKSYKELCSSFLDSNSVNKNYTGPEDEVVPVHETAREFLIRKNRVNIHEQNSKLSVFCFQYLTSPPFTLGVSEEGVLSHAKRGYSALQDYTVQYWFDHLLECVKSLDPISDGDKCQNVFNLARVFLRFYGNRENMAELLQAETYTELADAITKHLPTHGQERNAYLCIEIRTESLRQKIAKLDFEAFTAEEEKVFVNLYGPKTSYKCSKPWCDFFKGGLVSQANRQKHIDEHEFPHRCAFEDCTGFKMGFSTEDELQKHNGKWHGQPNDANSFPKLEVSSSLSGDSNESSLLEACYKGDIERVKQLLESDAGKKELDTEGRISYQDWKYPLGIAAEMGHKEICDLLISNGASVNKGAPLGIAAEMGHKEICDLLISNGASVNEGAPLLKAAENGHLEVYKFLVSNGASVDVDEGAPLRRAAERGHLEICKFLISKGANGNNVHRDFDHGESPLHLATRAGFLELCKLLLQDGADINSTRGRGAATPLQIATKKGHVDIIDLFLQQDGIEPNKNRSRRGTAAQRAAAGASVQALRIMQASGKVDMSVGLLRSACTRPSNSLDIIKYLLNNGYANEANEGCVWRALEAVPVNANKENIAKVGLAIGMLMSTGNPVFSDVKRLATEIKYESERRQRNRRIEQIKRRYGRERDQRKRMTEKETSLVISIMEYPRWRMRIKWSAWSKFVEVIKGVERDDELGEAIIKFLGRIKVNRSTTIIDDQPDMKGAGEPIVLTIETDEEDKDEPNVITIETDEEHNSS